MQLLSRAVGLPHSEFHFLFIRLNFISELAGLFWEPISGGFRGL